MDPITRLRIAIAHEQLLYWLYRSLKGIELLESLDAFIGHCEFWAQVLRMNGVEPYGSA